MEIKGKKAIVIGGASGMGRATAEALAARGADVVVLDRPRHAALVEVLCGEQAILARVTPDAVERLGLAPDGEVFVLFKSVGVELVG